MAAILAGEAPWSTSLRELDPYHARLSPPTVSRLAAALSASKAVRLDVLRLEREDRNGKELQPLVEALRHRAGRFLRERMLKTKDTSGTVDVALAGVLRNGCCPQLLELHIEGTHTSHSTQAL